MTRIKDGKDFYDPSYVNSWFVSFFPLIKMETVYYKIKFLKTMNCSLKCRKFFFLLELIDEETICFDCLFLAGFVGLSQNEKTGSMKPEIGWFIKKLSLKEQCSRILDEKNKKSVDSILMAREKILLLIEGNKNIP